MHLYSSRAFCTHFDATLQKLGVETKMAWLGVAVVLAIAWALYVVWRRSVPPIIIPNRHLADDSVQRGAGAPVLSVELSTNVYDASDPRGRFPEYHIEYADADGVVTSRDIQIVGRSGNDDRFRAWCFLRSEERTFRYYRVLMVRNLRTGRQISDLRKYIKRNW